VIVAEIFSRHCPSASNRATGSRVGSAYSNLVSKHLSFTLQTLTSIHALTRETLGLLTNFTSNLLTMSGTVSKIAAERNQKALLELAIKSGNGECRLHLDYRAWVSLFCFFCLCGTTTISSGDAGHGISLANLPLPSVGCVNPLTTLYNH